VSQQKKIPARVVYLWHGRDNCIKDLRPLNTYGGLKGRPAPGPHRMMTGAPGGPGRAKATHSPLPCRVPARVRRWARENPAKKSRGSPIRGLSVHKIRLCSDSGSRRKSLPLARLPAAERPRVFRPVEYTLTGRINPVSWAFRLVASKAGVILGAPTETRTLALSDAKTECSPRLSYGLVLQRDFKTYLHLFMDRRKQNLHNKESF